MIINYGLMMMIIKAPELLHLLSKNVYLRICFLKVKSFLLKTNRKKMNCNFIQYKQSIELHIFRVVTRYVGSIHVCERLHSFRRAEQKGFQMGLAAQCVYLAGCGEPCVQCLIPTPAFSRQAASTAAAPRSCFQELAGHHAGLRFAIPLVTDELSAVSVPSNQHSLFLSWRFSSPKISQMSQ